MTAARPRALGARASMGVAIVLAAAAAVTPALIVAPGAGAKGSPLAARARPASRAAATRALTLVGVGADFNCDGYGDVAVGVPGQPRGGAAGAGAVEVLFGGRHGAVANATLELTQGSAADPDRSEVNDHFGAAIATGDLDADGCTDLVVGAPDEDVGAVADAGAVWVFYGAHTAAGFDSARRRVLVPGRGGVPGAPQAHAHFGAALSTGDPNGDLLLDVAIGAPGAVRTGHSAAGTVALVHGLGAQPAAVSGQLLAPGLGGMPGAAHTGDRFGTALAFGDVDTRSGSVRDDELIVGAPGDSSDGPAGAGAIYELPGSATGAVAARALRITQGSPNVAGNSETGDAFGSTLAAGYFIGNDLVADVAVGTPLEDVGTTVDAGAVMVLQGTAHGLTALPGMLLSEGAGALPGVAEAHDQLGSALGALSTHATGIGTDLLIGVPHEGIGSAAAAGLAIDVPANTGNLSPAHALEFIQGTGGMPGASEAGDEFGASVGGADIDANGAGDIVIGDALEDIGTVVDAGAAVLVGSTSSGPAPTRGAQLILAAGQAGLGNAPMRGAHYGAAVST